MGHPLFSQKQAKFYYGSLKSFNILWGKTGSGKSFVTNLKLYKMMCEGETPRKFILSGNTNESLYDNVVAELLKFDIGYNWLEYKMVANRQRLICKHNGTRAKCIGANNDKAQDRIQGGNEDLWYADEVVKQPKSFVEMALSRVRYEKDDMLMSAPVIWTLNPDAASHYIKTDYIDKIKLIKGVETFYDFRDNPLMYDEKTKEFKGTFIKELKNKFSGVFALRMIEGKWANAEGCIFSEFLRDRHVVDVLPDMKEYFLCSDWGYKNPMVYLLVGVTGDDEYYVVDEYVQRQQLVDESLRVQLVNQFPQYRFNTDCFCDPSRPEQIRQLQDLFPELNVCAAENDVMDGIQEVAKYFKMRDNGKYGLYIHSRCVNTITELENYRWRENKTGAQRPDEPLKEVDHCMDSLRYGIYSRRQNFDFSGVEITTDYMPEEKTIDRRRT